AARDQRAISFDNLNGSSAGARLNNKRILYASEITVQASPLAARDQRAISFDNLNGSSAGARLNNKRILYASE
ncbi:hypothetical protein CQA89_33070, partial [Klebsiella pneumoniae]